MADCTIDDSSRRPFSLFVFCVSASPIGTGGPWCGCPCVAGAVVGGEEEAHQRARGISTTFSLGAVLYSSLMKPAAGEEVEG